MENVNFKLRVQKVRKYDTIEERNIAARKRIYNRIRAKKYNSENSSEKYSCHLGYKLPYEMAYTYFVDYYIYSFAKNYLTLEYCDCNLCKKIWRYKR